MSTSTFDLAAANKALADFFRNGNPKGEAGLEVGADVGLPSIEHIQIPRGMVRAWAVGMSKARYIEFQIWRDMPAELNDDKRAADREAWIAAQTFEEPYARKHSDGPADLDGKASWVTLGKVMVCEKKVMVRAHRVDTALRNTPRGAEYVEVDEFVFPTYSESDVRAFYTVNKGHIRDAKFEEPHQRFIHACRWWAVVGGMVNTSTNSEFTVVNDPTEDELDKTKYADDMVEFIIGYHQRAFTAAAARATSYRRSNHCTGGPLASGFVLRCLERLEFVKADQDKTIYERNLRLWTDAFYVACHATSVHGVLALMAGGDKHHWAEIDPSTGMIARWDVGESARSRMEPPTQIAGTAIVCDSFVVLKMVIKENLGPLLHFRGQAQRLVDAYRTVEENSIACGIGARYMLDGHPYNHTPVPFNQKDPLFADLAGELAIIATTYYGGTTIGKSASLKNAAQNLGDEISRNIWTALAKEKSRISASEIIKAVGAIKGASTDEAITKILSSNEDDVEDGVYSYNTENDRLAGIAGMGSEHIPPIDLSRIKDNLAAMAST